MALMSVDSIVGRAFFDKPLLGDDELVPMMSAVAVTMALAFCQMVRGHVIVPANVCPLHQPVESGARCQGDLVRHPSADCCCWPTARTTFELQTDFRIEEAGIVGVMEVNGAGKTTLFELVTGGNMPSAGRVGIGGHDIHQVRYAQRDRLALHYPQSYQLRSFRRTRPSFMLKRVHSDSALVHLFDGPQFNTQDGYIGFMLDFFRDLRAQGRVVVLCLHPNEPVHLDIMAEICERYIFVQKDAQGVSRLLFANSMQSLTEHAAVDHYLGALSPRRSLQTSPPERVPS